MRRDLIILGGGPAGLTAGMYASRARIDTLLLEKGLSGGQINNTAMVENYPGVEPISGAELGALMEKQALNFGVNIERVHVKAVFHGSEGFEVATDSEARYYSRTLILAQGASPVKLGIPGEERLGGIGVSYCAVCDGPFFHDQDIAVVGGGDSAVEESVYLTRFAKSVHLIHRRDELRAVKELQEIAINEPRIHIHWSTVPVEVLGTTGVEGLKIRSVNDGSEDVLPVYGVFFYVGLLPNPLEGLNALVHTDDRGFIITDANMACITPGLFAAGDVRAKTLRQISTAVGDGAAAAYSAQQFLEKQCLTAVPRTATQ